jgi:hypothetical protein
MSKIDLNAGITAMEDGRIFSHIAALDGGDYEYLSTYMKQIAALLKAGQAMHEDFKDIPDLFRPSIETRLRRSLDAWDAALGEEKV